jgi:hypothetical protein
MLIPSGSPPSLPIGNPNHILSTARRRDHEEAEHREISDKTLSFPPPINATIMIIAITAKAGSLENLFSLMRTHDSQRQCAGFGTLFIVTY